MTADTKDLTERLRQLEAAGRRECPVSRIKREIGPEAATVLDELLLNNAVTTASIHRELQGSDLAIARDSISNHRKGFCACNEGS